MTNVARLTAYLRVLTVKGLGLKTFKKLVDALGPPPWEEGKLYARVPKKAPLILKALKTPAAYEEKLVKLLEEENFSFLLYGTPGYPELLARTDEPPPVLFYAGEPPGEGVGVVGTRRPLELSLKRTEQLIKRERARVVSGGARGVDERAHLTAVKEGLPTVVVLGAGLLYAGRAPKVRGRKLSNRAPALGKARALHLRPAQPHHRRPVGEALRRRGGAFFRRPHNRPLRP